MKVENVAILIYVKHYRNNHHHKITYLGENDFKEEY